MNNILPFSFPSFAKLGDEMKCTIATYHKFSGEEYVVLSNIVLNNRSYPGEYQMRISGTNGELLYSIYPHDESGYPLMSGKEARLVFLRYETIGYNGRRYTHQSFLFQPLQGRITQGTDWQLI